GSGPALPAISASGPLKIPRSVQLPMKIPPTWLPLTTARASSAFFTPTISSWATLSRVDSLAAGRGGSAQPGDAGDAAPGSLVVANAGGRAASWPHAVISAEAAAST